MLRDALDAARALRGQLVYVNGEVGDGGGWTGGPLPGNRAPDCRDLRRAAVHHPLRLFELFANPRHTLLMYVDDVAQLRVRRAISPRRWADRGASPGLPDRRAHRDQSG